MFSITVERIMVIVVIVVVKMMKEKKRKTEKLTIISKVLDTFGFGNFLCFNTMDTNIEFEFSKSNAPNTINDITRMNETSSSSSSSTKLHANDISTDQLIVVGDTE